jgi:hypothetical protein
MSTTLITNNAHPPLYTTNTYTSAAITQKTGEHEEMFTMSQKHGEHSLGKKTPVGIKRCLPCHMEIGEDHIKATSYVIKKNYILWSYAKKKS